MKSYNIFENSRSKIVQDYDRISKYLENETKKFVESRYNKRQVLRFANKVTKSINYITNLSFYFFMDFFS